MKLTDTFYAIYHPKTQMFYRSKPIKVSDWELKWSKNIEDALIFTAPPEKLDREDKIVEVKFVPKMIKKQRKCH